MKLLLFNFGGGEIMLVVLAILLVLGPGKIPVVARTMGKFIRDIKKASDEIKTEINREADRQDKEKEFKNPLNNTKNTGVNTCKETTKISQ